MASQQVYNKTADIEIPYGACGEPTIPAGVQCDPQKCGTNRKRVVQGQQICRNGRERARGDASGQGAGPARPADDVALDQRWRWRHGGRRRVRDAREDLQVDPMEVMETDYWRATWKIVHYIIHARAREGVTGGNETVSCQSITLMKKSCHTPGCGQRDIHMIQVTCGSAGIPHRQSHNSPVQDCDSKVR